jgi:chromate transporter
VTAASALFIGFFRVGLLGFGGGPSMIPLMQRECVGAGFVSDDLFLQGLAAGNALPGPIALKMAWFVGYHHAGLVGALSALIGVTAPGVGLMAALGGVMLRYRHLPWMAAAIQGAKAATVGMLFWIAWDLAPTGVRGWLGVLFAVLAFAALVAKVHPAVVMVAAMVVGALVFSG